MPQLHTMLIHCKFADSLPHLPSFTAAWLAQFVEHWTAVQEVEGSNPRPCQHLGF